MEFRNFDFINTFELKDNEGENKVTTLENAIRKNIKPGINLHISGNPNAAIREIIRQNWGKKPNITLITAAIMTAYEISLIHCGLVKKIITSLCSFTYPTSGPIRIIQKAYKENSLEIENWSLYSLEQRLMAAALGVGFMPTRSLIGTNLAKENKDSFFEINDPFVSGQKIGLVKALEPDISILHGSVADSFGNTILNPPYYANLWGPRASKNGTIITVEKLVSTKFIRDHSSLVKLPGYLVNSVCIAPLGAHPRGLAGVGLKGIRGYSDDYAFAGEFRAASREMSTMYEWVKKWILGCKNQNEYLSKLGRKKITFIKNQIDNDDWKNEVEATARVIFNKEDYNEVEAMIVAASREIIERVKRNSFKTILAGIGVSGLPAWMAYYLLREEGYFIDLIMGTGLIGYNPKPLNPFTDNVSNVATCKMLTDTTDIYGFIVGGKRNKCLSILGAAQIDKYGNINTVKINNLFLTGAGGANDAISAKETIVVVKHSIDRLLDKLPFISCPGDTVKTLVTSLGIFEKAIESNEFILTKYCANKNFSSQADNIKNIKANCGWDLRVADNIREIARPSNKELMLLRLFDPQQFFIHG